MSAPITPAELVAYYQALLIVQYVLLPNASGTIGALVTEVVADLIYNQVRAGFNLDTAVGAQLDMMGQYRGASRQIVGLSPGKNFFSLVPVAAGSPASYFGFALTSQAPGINWYFIRPADVSAVQYILNDGEFAQLIRYLAALQSLNYTNESLDLLFEEFFGSYATITDNGDMSVTYTHDPSDPNLLFTFVDTLGLLPRPAGVEVIVA